MGKSRTAQANIQYSGVNFSTSMNQVSSFEYVDAASGEGDTISLSVSDKERKWIGAWYPQKGDRLTADIMVNDWEREGDRATLYCGSFVLDSISFSGFPIVGSIGGISIPADTDFKSTKRTRIWQSITVEQVGREIAWNAGFDLNYEAAEIWVSTLEQSSQGDCEFLFALCKSYGLAMKIFNGRIVIYDEAVYEARDAVVTIDASDMISLDDYNSSLDGTYTGGTITYTDPNTEEEITVNVGTVRSSNSSAANVTAKSKTDMYVRSTSSTSGKAYGVIPSGTTVAVIEELENGWLKIQYEKAPEGIAYTSNRGGNYYTIDKTQTQSSSVDVGPRCLEINEKADNTYDAELKAVAAVNQANKTAVTMKIKIMANLKIIATSNVLITGLEKLNGKYAVDKVTHSVGGGYTMSLELRLIQGRLSAR